MSLAEQLFMFTPVAAVAALVFAFTKSAWISKQEVGTDKMSTIAGHIRDGAMAFLSREYKILAVFALVVAVFLGYSGSTSAESHWLVAVAFILGAICSGLAGYFGMRIATSANVRTTNAARKGLSEALTVAFSGGTVMGMSVVVGLISIRFWLIGPFDVDADVVGLVFAEFS